MRVGYSLKTALDYRIGNYGQTQIVLGLVESAVAQLLSACLCPGLPGLGGGSRVYVQELAFVIAF